MSLIRITILIAILYGCNQAGINRDKVVEPILNPVDKNATKGNADFTKYISIGDSYSAGQMDGTTYNDSQKNCFPKILSESFKLIEGGVFNQPDINTDIGFSNFLTYKTLGILGRTRFIINNGSVSIEPTPNGVLPTDYTGEKTALNNIAVPYLRTIDLHTKGVDLQNPYLSRILTNPTDSYFNRIQQSKKDATFYSIWLGIIDVALWAIEGGEGVDAATYDTVLERYNAYRSIDTLVDVRDFRERYKELINSIFNSPNIKGFVVTIPEFTKIPYFNFVKYNELQINNELAVATKEYFKSYNELIDIIKDVESSLSFRDVSLANIEDRKIQFNNGNNNKVLIKDNELKNLSDIVDTVIKGIPDNDARVNQLIALKSKIGTLEKVRHANANDIILFPALKIIGKPLNNNSPFLIPGVTVALEPKYIMSTKEKQKLNNRINQFNDAIEDIISDRKLSDQIVIINSTNILNSFIAIKRSLVSLDPLDGIFSTDGTHLNPRGQAILADSILNSITKKFGGKFPPLDISSFRGNEFPTAQ